MQSLIWGRIDFEMISSEYGRESSVWTCSLQCSLRELSLLFTVLCFVKVHYYVFDGQFMRISSKWWRSSNCPFSSVWGHQWTAQHCDRALALVFVMFSYVLICQIRQSSIHRLKFLLLHLLYNFYFSIFLFGLPLMK